MRVLVVGNRTSLTRTPAAAASAMVTALSKHGVTVRQIGTWAQLHQPLEYDVIHAHWQAESLNDDLACPVRWNKGNPTYPLVSVSLHDLPPQGTCPWESRADVVVTSVPYAGSHLVLPPPIPDWVPEADLPQPTAHFSVGLPSVREPGHALVAQVCARRGWHVNHVPPRGVALSLEQEIARLATSTVNVCWYPDAPGVSAAPSVCLASQRPLLLSGSSQFAYLQPYREVARRLVLYTAPAAVGDALRDPVVLETALSRVYGDWVTHRLRMPGPVIHRELGWKVGAQKLVNTWRQAQQAAR